MVTWQRRRGHAITLFPTISTVDNRGTPVKGPDLDSPIQTRAWIIPDRSSAAEVPGQQEIEVIRLGIEPSSALDGAVIDRYSRVEWDGDDWDVAAPPGHRYGTRHVQHQTILLRRRTPKKV